MKRRLSLCDQKTESAVLREVVNAERRLGLVVLLSEPGRYDFDIVGKA